MAAWHDGAAFAVVAVVGVGVAWIRRARAPAVTPPGWGNGVTWLGQDGDDSGDGAAAAERVVKQYDGVLGAAIRRDFALDFAQYRHLNHGSYGTAPHSVMAAARAAMDRVEAFPDDFFRRRATAEYIALSDRVGGMVAAPAGSTVLVENATAAVNTVLRSLEPLAPTDVLVITDNTYNACRLAVNWVANVFGCTVATVTFTLPVTTATDLLTQFDVQLTAIATTAASAGRRVRWVLLDHITSPTAIVMPVADMVASVHAIGADVMVDGAHAPGQLPLDMVAIGADWYTGNLHKWCFTVKGVAFLYTAPHKQATTQSLIISHNAAATYQKRFFMQGTNDQSRYHAVPAALDFVTERLGGMDHMRQYNAALATAGAHRLCMQWGSTMLTPRHLSAPFLVCVEAPLDVRAFITNAPPEAPLHTLTPDQVAACVAADPTINERIAQSVFDVASIQAQFFHWPVAGAVRIYCRISAQVYNTLSDYDALAQAVLAVATTRTVHAAAPAPTVA